MASDEAYVAFLDRANEDLRAGRAAAAAAAKKPSALKSSDRGVAVPPELAAVVDDGDAWVYVSDADEPFVPVALRFAAKTLPDEETFAKLVGLPDPSAAAGGIEILDVARWDSAGRYEKLVGAVRAAAAGADVRVYRVPVGGTRVEYFLVGVDAGAGLLVGFKALAIES